MNGNNYTCNEEPISANEVYFLLMFYFLANIIYTFYVIQYWMLWNIW